MVIPAKFEASRLGLGWIGGVPSSNVKISVVDCMNLSYDSWKNISCYKMSDGKGHTAALPKIAPETLTIVPEILTTAQETLIIV